MVFISGHHLVFISGVQSQKSLFRKNLLENNSSKIKTLSIATDQLFKDTKSIEWIENNKEIILKGRYHEVLGMRRTAKETLIFLIEDDAENKLFDEYYQNTAQHKSLTHLLQLFLSLHFTSPDQTSVPTVQGQAVDRIISDIQAIIHTYYPELIKPPTVNLS